MLNKFDVTLINKSYIDEIRNFESLGVYVYIIYLLKFEHVSINKNKLAELLSAHFKIRESEALEHINYFLSLNLGDLNDYIK